MADILEAISLFLVLFCGLWAFSKFTLMELENTILLAEGEQWRIKKITRHATRLSLYCAIGLCIVLTCVSLGIDSADKNENKYLFYAGVDAATHGEYTGTTYEIYKEAYEEALQNIKDERQSDRDDWASRNEAKR